MDNEIREWDERDDESLFSREHPYITFDEFEGAFPVFTRGPIQSTGSFQPDEFIKALDELAKSPDEEDIEIDDSDM
jgi:hypothetical protein